MEESFGGITVTTTFEPVSKDSNSMSEKKLKKRQDRIKELMGKRSILDKLKTFLNFEGGLPISEESNPTAVILSLKGIDCCNVLKASSSLKCRK